MFTVCCTTFNLATYVDQSRTTTITGAASHAASVFARALFVFLLPCPAGVLCGGLSDHDPEADETDGLPTLPMAARSQVIRFETIEE